MEQQQQQTLARLPFQRKNLRLNKEVACQTSHTAKQGQCGSFEQANLASGFLLCCCGSWSHPPIPHSPNLPHQGGFCTLLSIGQCSWRSLGTFFSLKLMSSSVSFYFNLTVESANHSPSTLLDNLSSLDHHNGQQKQLHELKGWRELKWDTEFESWLWHRINGATLGQFLNLCECQHPHLQWRT